MAAVLLSVHIHCASSVWIKRIGARMQALETTAGALLVALPLFTLSWALFNGHWPGALSRRTFGAIVYLAVFGLALGLVLSDSGLRKLQATWVVLIALITPVITLILGQWVNGESVLAREWVGHRDHPDRPGLLSVGRELGGAGSRAERRIRGDGIDRPSAGGGGLNAHPGRRRSKVRRRHPGPPGPGSRPGRLSLPP